METEIVEYNGELVIIIPDKIVKIMGIKVGDTVFFDYQSSNDWFSIRKRAIERKKT